MDIVFGMCVGSAIQIALVVAPVLVLASWMIGQPMNLVFGSPLDLFAIASTAFVVRAIAADGETTWFEGLLLVGVYVLFALAYYFESPR
jgi:Ca2+:H+ antiporter